MEAIRENFIFLIVALIIIVGLAFVLGIFRGIQTEASYYEEEGRVYGLYSHRNDTAAGDFLVTYEYPNNWYIDKNTITSYDGYVDHGNVEMYFVFEDYETEYPGFSQVSINERSMLMRESYEEVNGNENYIMDVYWPVDSINSSIRFSCIGDSTFSGTISNDCKRFIYTFRLD